MSAVAKEIAYRPYQPSPVVVRKNGTLEVDAERQLQLIGMQQAEIIKVTSHLSHLKNIEALFNEQKTLLQSTTTQRDKLESTVGELCVSNSTLKRSCAALNLQVIDLQSELSATQTQWQCDKESLECERQLEVESMRKQMEITSEQMECRLQLTVAKFQLQMAKLECELEAEKRRNESTLQCNKNLSERLNQLHRSMEAMKAVSAMESKLSGCVSQCISKRGESLIASLETLVLEAFDECKSLESELDAASEMHSDLQSQFESNQSELQSVTNSKEALSKELDKLQRETEALAESKSSDVSKLELEKNAITEELQSVRLREKKIVDKLRQLRQVKSERHTMSARIGELKDECASQSLAKEAWLQKHKSLVAQIQELKAHVKAKDSLLASIYEENEQRGKEIKPMFNSALTELQEQQRFLQAKDREISPSATVQRQRTAVLSSPDSSLISGALGDGRNGRGASRGLLSDDEEDAEAQADEDSGLGFTPFVQRPKAKAKKKKKKAAAKKKKKRKRKRDEMENETEMEEASDSRERDSGSDVASSQSSSSAPVLRRRSGRGRAVAVDATEKRSAVSSAPTAKRKKLNAKEHDSEQVFNEMMSPTPLKPRPQKAAPKRKPKLLIPNLNL